MNKTIERYEAWYSDSVQAHMRLTCSSLLLRCIKLIDVFWLGAHEEDVYTCYVREAIWCACRKCTCRVHERVLCTAQYDAVHVNWHKKSDQTPQYHATV